MLAERRVRDAFRGIRDVANYTALGYAARSRRWDARDTDVDLAGKVCVVTGGSQGLGYGIAEALAAKGATVVIAARDRARGEAARRAIAASSGADRAVFEAVDVSSVRAVLDFAAHLGSRFGRVDVLVNNAGAMFDARRLSVDGVELSFATNVLGGFVLTRALAPLLRAAAPSRVVHVGSAAQYVYRLETDALVAARGRYIGELVYAHTKRAIAELGVRWAAELAPQGISSNCMHPGLVLTPGAARSFPMYGRTLGRALRSLGQGADTAVWLAVARSAARETGGFWFDRARAPEHVVPWTRCEAGEVDRLWSACERLAS